jgi:acyl-CoA synthetase (AMP-forming)/AMP-acid ligase II
MTVEQCHPSLRPGCGAAFSVEVAGEERLVVAYEVERRSQSRPLLHPERRRLEVEPGCDPEAPEPVDLEALLVTMRQAVTEQHGVSAYAVVLLKAGSIPKTSSGKIQRYASREGFLTQTLDVVCRWQAPLALENDPTAVRDSADTTNTNKQRLLQALLARRSSRLAVTEHAA